MCTNVSLRSGTVNRCAIGRWGPIDRTGAAERLLGSTKRGLKLGQLLAAGHHVLRPSASISPQDSARPSRRASSPGELLLRRKANTIVVAAPPSVLEQWKGELEDRFGLVFEILDRAYLSRMRRERGFGVNPWRRRERLRCSTSHWAVAVRRPTRSSSADCSTPRRATSKSCCVISNRGRRNPPLPQPRACANAAGLLSRKNCALIAAP